MRAILLTVLLSLPAFAQQPLVELLEHPEVLLKHDLDVRTVTLGGVRLGDPASKLVPAPTPEELKQGYTRDRANGYAFADGHVKGFTLKDPKAVEKLGIKTFDDVERLLGKPTGLTRTETISSWHYTTRLVEVNWVSTDGKPARLPTVYVSFPKAAKR